MDNGRDQDFRERQKEDIERSQEAADIETMVPDDFDGDVEREVVVSYYDDAMARCGLWGDARWQSKD